MWMDEKIGRRIIPVVENFEELGLILKHATAYGVRPRIGVRVKLASEGSGKWRESAGDKSKFGTICDGMINSGVNVLLIVNLDSDSGTACLKKAQAAGVKTIDYDRLTLTVETNGTVTPEEAVSYAAALAHDVCLIPYTSGTTGATTSGTTGATSSCTLPI